MMEKKKLLIVEDDVPTQSVFKILLKDYDTVFCVSEAELKTALEENEFDLILMDIALPHSRDGLVLTHQLKNDVKYAHIPIICITAHVYPKDRENAFKAGVDEFMAKPFRNSELLSKIKVQLEKDKRSKDL